MNKAKVKEKVEKKNGHKDVLIISDNFENF